MARVVENALQRTDVFPESWRMNKGLSREERGGNRELAVRWADSGQRKRGFKGPQWKCQAVWGCRWLGQSWVLGVTAAVAGSVRRRGCPESYLWGAGGNLQGENVMLEHLPDVITSKDHDSSTEEAVEGGDTWCKHTEKYWVLVIDSKIDNLMCGRKVFFTHSCPNLFSFSPLRGRGFWVRQCNNKFFRCNNNSSS